MKFKLLFFALLPILFTACNKQELDLNKEEASFQNFMFGDKDFKEGYDKDGKHDCFKLVFPITISMPDGSALTGSDKDLFAQVKAWYKTNPTIKEKPEFNFPIEIQWEKDIIKTVENEEALKKAKAFCDKDNWDKKDCFELVFPVTWTLPDGSFVDMNDEKDWDTLKAWYESHPDVKEKPNLNYPVMIIFEDGETTNIDSEEEMIAKKEDCK